MEEYYKMIKGSRAPASRSEAEIASIGADNLAVVMLEFAIPSEVRLYEQLAIFTLWPTINRSPYVEPLVDPKWGDLSSALKLAAEFMLLFQFASMLNRYTLANTSNMTTNPSEQAMIGKPLWVYAFPGADALIYSSVNMAVNTLSINYGTLMSCVNFCYLYGPKQLILSLTPLSVEQQKAYSTAPASDSRHQLQIDVYKDGILVHTAESARKLAIWWKANVGKGGDSKTLRPYLHTNGIYMGYQFSVTPILRSHVVYRFDAKSLSPMTSLSSMTVAFQSVNMKWYNFVYYVDNQLPINGVIYSREPVLRVKHK